MAGVLVTLLALHASHICPPYTANFPTHPRSHAPASLSSDRIEEGFHSVLGPRQKPCHSGRRTHLRVLLALFSNLAFALTPLFLGHGIHNLNVG